MQLTASLHINPLQSRTLPSGRVRPLSICQTCAQNRAAAQLPESTPPSNSAHQSSRRAVLLSAAIAAASAGFTGCPPARADIVYEAVRSSVRPETDSRTAVVSLLDAKGTLLELKDLASTLPDSKERFRARRLLPGMAKRLRELGPAVPQLVALAQGSRDSEAQLSREYGGTGGEDYGGGAVPLYKAIGSVITLSGRTIQEQAQASPQFANNAIACIDDLLAALPKDLVDEAKGFRKQRAAALS